MKKRQFFCLYILLLLAAKAFSQSPEKTNDVDQSIRIPPGFLSHIKKTTAKLNRRLDRQSEQLLTTMVMREKKLCNKLSTTDSTGMANLFGESGNKYRIFLKKLKTDTGALHVPLNGEYAPYLDSLQGTLSFLKIQRNSPDLQRAAGQLQALQGKMADADQIKTYVRQRRQAISDYISHHSEAAKLLGARYSMMGKELYYYSQQVRSVRETLNNPDLLEKKTLAILNTIPAFHSFMQRNSQLAGLFGVPGNYSSPSSLSGLQTRDQVNGMIQSQIGGASGQAALQSSVDAGRSQLAGYKDKLEKLGIGSGDIDMPDFKPNEQKEKTFLSRLEYGTSLQTTRTNSFFPTISDLGGTLGYKINNISTIGVGATYKLGWGNGIKDIHLTSQGVGLRSFLDVKAKGSIFLSGGFEYNYTMPFATAQQLYGWSKWSRSGLIGLSKIVSMKSRAFKKTKLQLLWDFLSYQQIPRTQPILFRIGYTL